VSPCRAVSTWSSCTGVAVCVTFSVSPFSSTGADGEPDVRSTKKLPSRKMRGRIFAVASACSGRPSSSIFITTTAPLPSSCGLIAWTLPTSTPAIRTGEPGRIEFADSNVALISNGFVNGMSFVKPRNTRITNTTAAIRPIITGLRGLRRLTGA
jgi:hypothetical protein